MKTTAFIFPFFVAFLLFFASEIAEAQDTDVLRDAQDSVSEQSELNPVQLRGDQELPVEPPPSLEELNLLEPAAEETSDALERGANRFVTFTNRTSWYLHCYIDGFYFGTVAPGVRLHINLPQSRTYSLFAYTRFNNGETLQWGEISRYISGSYTMTLNSP